MPPEPRPAARPRAPECERVRQSAHQNKSPHRPYQTAYPRACIAVRERACRTQKNAGRPLHRYRTGVPCGASPAVSPAGQTRSRCCRSHPHHAPARSPPRARCRILVPFYTADAMYRRPAARHIPQTRRCCMGSTTFPEVQSNHSRLQQHRAHIGAWFHNFQLWMP